MFFGHIAVGLAAKPVAPKASLGALLLSTTVMLAFLVAVPQLSLLSTLAFVLLLPLGNWVDRHRSLATA